MDVEVALGDGGADFALRVVALEDLCEAVRKVFGGACDWDRRGFVLVDDGVAAFDVDGEVVGGIDAAHASYLEVDGS